MISLLVNMQLWITIFCIIGVYALIWWLIDNLKSTVLMAKSVLQPYFQPQEKQTLAERFGNWAVITGSTDGIGRQYAFEFARNGINVVLISRTESKLIKVANEIESKYAVKTKWIAADFTKGRELYEHIRQELEGIPVGILVNNVGLMYDYPEEIGGVPEQMLWDIVNVNIQACTQMTRLVVNQMKSRRKGAIINISSGSEMQPLPYTTVYGASKIYVKNFSLAIRNELAQYNIFVQLVTPLFVVTKMNEYATAVMTGSRLLYPSVEDYVKFAFFTLGKSYETTGYWSHGLQYAAMKLVPCWVRTLVGADMNLAFREDYLKKHKTKT